MKFRYLKETEIECRVATCNEKGVSLLLYKDARCDMRILDETAGAEHWKRSHEVVNGNLFCNVSIYFKELGWVTKQDVGTESYTEKEKGQASDSFKRACVNWGIGRELYTSPFIWISNKDVTLMERNGKITTYDKFRVEQIIIENGEIVALSIRNDSLGRRVYLMDKRDVNGSEGKTRAS